MQARLVVAMMECRHHTYVQESCDFHDIDFRADVSEQFVSFIFLVSWSCSAKSRNVAQQQTKDRRAVSAMMIMKQCQFDRNSQAK